MSGLKVAPGLVLPLESVTRTFGILAVRGAGKSNAAVVMAEEMFEAGLHWVTIDPKGDWWGIRSSKDGKGPGLPVIVFGGKHGDVPLEPASGSMLAEMIVSEAITCVIDVSEFTEAEKIRFLAGHGAEEGFAQRLFRLKDFEQHPTHVFLEEADDYIPQKPFRDQAKLVHVFQRLVKMGRNRGLGATVISQRSARVNKDVLTQVETLIALRTTSPQDRKAILEWVEHHAVSKELVESLPNLEDGEAWLWSPQWLKLVERIRFRQRETFDSGATPVVGARARRPATLADVDLAAISKKMADTIERAKESDPRELRRQVAELQKQLVKAQSATRVEEKVVEMPVEIEVPVLSEQDIARMEAVQEQIVTALDEAFAPLKELAAEKRRGAARPVRELPTPPQHPSVPSKPTTPEVRPAPRSTETNGNRADVDGITGPEQKILDALAWYRGIGIFIPTKQQVGLIAGYKIGKAIGGHYGNTLSRLRTRGLVDYPSPGNVTLTAAGEALARDPGIEQTDQGLQEAILGLLTRPEAKLLAALIEAHPGMLTREELASRTGYEPSGAGGGHFGNMLSRLRTLGLADYPTRGAVQATDVLFIT